MTSGTPTGFDIKHHVFLSLATVLLMFTQATLANDGALRVTAQINHPLKPIDRGHRYEDPLDEALTSNKLGNVTGGGTLQSKSGEIQYVDVEISLADEKRGIPFIINKLESYGAPKGSRIIFPTQPGKEISFGKMEGVGVYLDGVNLPPEVYKSSDINFVIAELSNRLGGKEHFQSYWEGSKETALYFYGANAKEMIRAMADFLQTYPLCKNARVITIAPR